MSADEIPEKSKGDAKPEPKSEGKAEGKEGGAPAPARARKLRRVDARGVVHVKASFNNTLITITTSRGEVLSRGSAGPRGFNGTRKSTPFAAQRASEQAATLAMRLGLREVEVKVKGAGSGREAAV